MKWFLSVALLGGIYAAAILPAWRDREEVVSRVTVATCAEDLGPSAAGSPSLTWKLRLADDFYGMPVEMSDLDLIRLGFDRHSVAMLGQPRPRDMEYPTPRPAWVRLRPDSADGGRLVIDTVSLLDPRTAPHPNTITVQARIGFSDLGETVGKEAQDSTLPRRPRGRSARVRVGILMLNPPLLHLTPAQHQALTAVQAGLDCRTSPARAVVAMGRHGSLWVERIFSK
jgi:hypothetical protein